MILAIVFALASLFSAPPLAADAPFVPALPSSTPGQALSHLRSAILNGSDDQALGEAADFLGRYPDDPRRDEVRLAAGALHLRRGESASALKYLLPLARAPSGTQCSRALHLAGAALIDLGREVDALKLIPMVDAASATDRWLALAQIWRAAALDRQGRKEQAGEVYRAIAASGQESPVRVYALAAIGVDWDRQGRPDRAQDAFERAQREAIKWRQDDVRDSLALAAAHALARAHRLEDAAAAYLQFIRQFPSSPLVVQAYYERGLALKRLGRKDQAVRSFEALLSREPDSVYSADAHLQIGQLETELGHPNKALDHYRRMGQDSPAKDADREALLLMAKVHYNAKRWTQAAPLYRRWLEDAPPRDPRTKDVLGLLLVSLWSSDPDDSQLAELTAKIPDHPLAGQVRWRLAANAYRKGDWETAQSLFQRQIEADPASPKVSDARYFRAEALRRLGRGADSVDAYRRFLIFHPTHARGRDARLALGALLYQSGDASGAASVYATVRGTDAVAADAAYNRALSLIKAGRDAAAAWEEFARRFPNHPQASEAWWTAGRLRDARGDRKASADYARAVGPSERTKALYALGRFEERFKRRAAAKSAYQKLSDARPKDDPARLGGLLRLALILELEDRPKSAASFYLDVVQNSKPGSSLHETAQKRLTPQ